MRTCIANEGSVACLAVENVRLTVNFELRSHQPGSL